MFLTGQFQNIFLPTCTYLPIQNPGSCEGKQEIFLVWPNRQCEWHTVNTPLWTFLMWAGSDWVKHSMYTWRGGSLSGTAEPPGTGHRWSSPHIGHPRSACHQRTWTLPDMQHERHWECGLSTYIIDYRISSIFSITLNIRSPSIFSKIIIFCASKIRSQDFK